MHLPVFTIFTNFLNLPLLSRSIFPSIFHCLLGAFLPLFAKDFHKNYKSQIYGMNKRFPDFVRVTRSIAGPGNQARLGGN